MTVICEPTTLHHLYTLGFVAISAYLIGSIPFGYILSQKFGYGDIRKIGSGNIGATNVLRTGNKKLALATLLLDASKAIVALTILSFIANFKFPLEAFYNYCDKFHVYCDVCGGPTMTAKFQISNVMFITLFAIIGHCYPVWLKFKGGKGVATALGALLAAVPIAGLAACAAWLITAKLTKISSLSALVAIAIAPLVTLFVYGSAPATVCVLITLLVWWRHRENIKRLLKGEEPKIGAKKEEEQDNPQS